MSDIPGELHWRWEDPTWPDRVGDDPSRLFATPYGAQLTFATNTTMSRSLRDPSFS
jgi:hypothetical protein